MTPRAAAELCDYIYSPNGEFEQIISVKDIVGGTVKTATGTALVFRGTENLGDFLSDIDAVPVPVDGLGNVHQGFYQDLPDFMEAAIPHLSGEILLMGHSLGASRAELATGILLLNNIPVTQLYSFEPAKVATDGTLWNLLASVNPQLYKNGNDLVPDLPDMLDYKHPAALQRIGPALWPFPNIEDHLIENVIPHVPLR